ncbi:MAG: universal stress protein, partial [Candidatus Bathyarchaeum sp.]
RIGNKILAEAKHTVKKQKIPVKAVLKEGDAVHEIVRTAKEEKIDLIVMGARGVSRIKELLLGSVSHGVCRKTHCSVMIVK